MPRGMANSSLRAEEGDEGEEAACIYSPLADLGSYSTWHPTTWEPLPLASPENATVSE
jgi:hypothetical protein